MGVLARPIDVIVTTKDDGELIRIRFRIDRKDGSQVVVNIDKIIDRKAEKIAGCETILFTCEAMEKTCELKFEKSTCKWVLFRA